MRKSGILMPVASLPGKYGIGTFGEEAYKFVDMLKLSGQGFWQMLPLGPTGFGDSPYQSFSTFSGNPYFIDLELLIEEGLLTKNECEAFDYGTNEERVPYEKVYKSRFILLRKAYKRSNIKENKEYVTFIKKNSYWLDDYALYMAIKDSYGGKSFSLWDEDIRTRQIEALDRYKKEYEEEIDFYRFIQFKFDEQWKNLRKYANDNGIRIIGDIPIYVAFDSADTWANPELFQIDTTGFPTEVAGVPPDGFSQTGQMWGNPLYDWKYHKKTGYEWWISRIRHCYEMYDMIRVDHFRAFDEYYSIPYGVETAENGKWKKGPGIEFFDAIKSSLGKLDMIAEDLGYLKESVIKMVEKTGYPGMKVLQFAFDSREESDYLPHKYPENSVVYTGTHDNSTIVGWFEELIEPDRELALDYLKKQSLDSPEEIADAFIGLAMGAVSKLCIIPMQDYLALGNEARTNVPSTLGGGNWEWRMKRDAFTESLALKIRGITKQYGR